MNSLPLILFACVSIASCFLYTNSEIIQEEIDADPDQPLILTPLIKANKIKEAQKAAEVKYKGLKHVKSYSGYFTVNEVFNSNLFFWFFPSTTDYANVPVVLWLQGGPGATSFLGLFTENGPFVVKSKHGVKLRKYSWSNTHSVIYIDNPVGTGYSFTREGGYLKNETSIGSDLYEAIQQFFHLFPELQKNDFFVAGESYAGKYVPALSYTIHQRNPSAQLKINLKGLAIGNGLCDPENQMKYSDYLYQIGLIDTNAKTQFQDMEQKLVNFIRNKQWLEANNVFSDLFLVDSKHKTCLFENITGFNNHFNLMLAHDSQHSYKLMCKYVQRADIRRAIHVGNVTFNPDNEEVAKNLAEDMMQSVAPWISELLNHYRVLFYNGQLDIIVPYPLTVNFLKNLKFNSADVYKTAARHKWYVNSALAGYVKEAGNLTEILVRNAGHMVPGDQPVWALDLITRFTRNKRYH